MFILQVTPTSLIHKMATTKKTSTAGKTLYRTLSLHIYSGGNIYLDRDMRNDMAAERGNMAILKECNVFEYGSAFRLNSANCEKNNFKKIDVCLIYRKPWLNFTVSTRYVSKRGKIKMVHPI